jgi:hypothetical protein
MTEQAQDENISPLTIAFSLLWPKGRRVNALALEEQSGIDLDTQKLIQFIASDGKLQKYLGDVFNYLCQDAETINFRLDIIEDLLNNSALVGCWEALVPVINEMRYYTTHQNHENWTELIEVIWRLRELEHYMTCIERLFRVYHETDGIHSEGLLKLRGFVNAVVEDPVFKKLTTTLPTLLEKVNNVKSITIGVNLNAGLVPSEATLISINSDRYSDGPLYGRLVGKPEWKGISPLHKTPLEAAYANPLMIPLFRDIASVMQKAIRPLAKALREFIGINTRLIIKLQEEFQFYLGAVKVIQTLRGCGLPMTRPRVEESGRRCFVASGLYNINLAILLLQTNRGEGTNAAAGIVENDFRLDDNGRIIILTGPNRGGKTTFLQAVGLTQVLFQAGLFVPAREAGLSIADKIFTHYPAREQLEKGTGRFGEEAQRLQIIFRHATRASLILLNESLASTSLGESLFLAEDMVRVLRMMGVRVVFTTHLHQLAGAVDRINADTTGESRLLSMVAMVEKKKVENENKTDAQTREAAVRDSIRPTFKIVIGPPEGQSYAIELATRFGISREQLVADLTARGIISLKNQ